MSEPLKLGLIITTDQGRDAIHIAIAPVSADEVVYPAQRVGLVAGTTDKVSPLSEPHIGIVDPYLRHAVVPGQRFWLCLFPQTVTSLRHEWTHPAFAPQAINDSVNTKIVESKIWLTNFALRYHADYDSMVDAAANGYELCFGTDIEYSDFAEDSEFWTHIQNVTGKILSYEQRSNNNRFRCAC